MNTLLTESINKHILKITLNRPDKLNALSEEVLSELENTFLEAKNNSAIRAILLTGSGKAFCAGADIQQLAEANAELGLAFARRGQKVFSLLETLGKPSLAAINGHALGGGCELAMSTTIRIASEKALLGQPEVKLGVIPGYGGTQRLARLVGKGRALDLCVTGRFIDAKTAEQWGLITEVTSPEKLMTRAEEILNSIIELAPIAINSVIDVINEGFDLPLEKAFELEAKHFALTCATHDKQEGVQAFLEKRKAVFEGN